MQNLKAPIEGYYVPLFHLVARLKYEFSNSQKYRNTKILRESCALPPFWQRGPLPPVPSSTQAPGTTAPRKDLPPGFKCDQCSSEFRNESGLKNHIGAVKLKRISHHDFKCDQCGSNFKNQSGLKIHIRNKHKGQRPWDADRAPRPPSPQNGGWVQRQD